MIQARRLLLSGSPQPAFSANFMSGVLDPRITFTRASTATDLFYSSTSPVYNAYSVNVPRFLFSAGTGLCLEGARTQFLGVTDSPATQTTGVLATGTYCYWCIGSGSLSVAGGTATITGGGVATQGVFKTFTVTVAGTVVVTVTQPLSRFQLEGGAFPSSYIPNAGAAATSVTRAIDVPRLLVSKFPYSPVAGTLGAVFACGPGAAVNLGIGVMVSLHKSDGTGNNVIMMDGTQGPPQRTGFTLSASGTFYLNNTTSGPGNLGEGVVSKGCIAWDSSSAVICSSPGLAVNVPVSIALPQQATQLDFGQRGGSTPMFGFLQRVDYWSSKIPNNAVLGYVK